MAMSPAARRSGWVLLFLAPAGLAQSWNELGEAGQLPATAQAVLGGGPLLQINGRIDDPTEPQGRGNDRDMYLIHIYDPATFSATTVGGTTLDTQLFLFTAGGQGVAFDDDDPTGVGGLQSRLTGTFVPGPGDYMLAISRYDRDATAAGAEIWADAPFNVERAPDGPGAAGPIDGWNGSVASALTGDYTIFLTGAALACNGFVEDFEGVAASAPGTVLTGQVGYYLPPATTSVDFLAFTYAGNALGVPPNPLGGAQFIGANGPGAGAFARAQKDITYPTWGNVSVGFDICASFLGTLPATQNLGSVSMQPFPGGQSLIALARWSDPNTAANWNADFVWCDAAGTQLTESVPDARFQNLLTSHWYRWAFDVSVTTNQVLQVRLTDLTTSTTATYDPAGRYMIGGIAGAPAPTGFRWFSGGGSAGNTLAFDNMCVERLPRQPGLFNNPQPIDLASVPATDDWGPALTPDEMHMIFASSRPGGLGGYDLYETWRASVGGPWAVPVPLAWANTPGGDYEVNLVETGTGAGIYEMNWIRLAGGASQVWTATVQIFANAPAFVLVPPAPALGNVNTPGWFNDDPHLTDDGLTMFFTTDAGGAAAGGADIYTATRPLIGAPWLVVGPFAPANSPALDHSPMPEANGRIVWFASTRPGGAGGSSDLYLTYLDGNTGNWSPPHEVRRLDSANWESNMWRNGITGRMYFSRFPATGGRIYQAGYMAPHVAIWDPNSPLRSAVIVDRVVPLAVPQPWEIQQLFHRNWVLPLGSNLVVENYDWRVANTWNFVLFSAVPVGAPQPLLPGLEIGTFMLDMNYVFTHGLAVADAEGRASIGVGIPANPLLSGLSFTIQTLQFDPAAAPGHVVVDWSEPGRGQIQ